MAKKKQIFSNISSNTFIGFPDALKVNGLVFLSGVRPSQKNNTKKIFDNLPEGAQEKNQGFPLADHMESEVAYDAWNIHTTMDKILEIAGSSANQILRQHMWQKDKRFFSFYANRRQHIQKMQATGSGLGVTDVYSSMKSTIGLDAIAVCPGENSILTEREVVAKVDDIELPSAAFYSQAVRTGPLVFTAGHIPIKTSEKDKPVVNSYEDIPLEGRFLSTGRSHPDSRDGPIASQTWFTYNELKRTLENQGLTLDDTINSTVYLTDIRDFPTFHRVHRHFFPDRGPALTVTGFAEVGHRGCLIEIELTASESNVNNKKINIPWPIINPFYAPAAIVSGDFIFYSGILGLNSKSHIASKLEDCEAMTKELSSLISNHNNELILIQIWASLNLLSKIANSSSSSINDLAKITIYMRKSEYYELFDLIIKHFISSENLPAIEFVIIPNPGPIFEAEIQIEAIGIPT